MHAGRSQRTPAACRRPCCAPSDPPAEERAWRKAWTGVRSAQELLGRRHILPECRAGSASQGRLGKGCGGRQGGQAAAVVGAVLAQRRLRGGLCHGVRRPAVRPGSGVLPSSRPQGCVSRAARQHAAAGRACCRSARCWGRQQAARCLSAWHSGTRLQAPSATTQLGQAPQQVSAQPSSLRREGRGPTWCAAGCAAAAGWRRRPRRAGTRAAARSARTAGRRRQSGRGCCRAPLRRPARPARGTAAGRCAP